MPTKIESCDELINPLRLTEAIDPAKEDKRNTYCPNYDACLDRAIEFGWKSWSCEDCVLKEERGEVEMKTKRGIERKCTDCPKIGPIKGRGKCPICYNRWYAEEYRKAGPLKIRGIKKNVPVPSVEKLKVKSKISSNAPEAHKSVTIDFREHRELLAALRKATEEEFRNSVEAQVLWYIKKGLKEGGHE